MADVNSMRRPKSAAAPNPLTFEEVRALLSYDPETGILRWKVRASNRVRAGDRAGSIDGREGYRRIRIGGRNYKEHRIAWLLQTGKWPAEQIDHRNGVRWDNRFNNLREATNAENGRNGDLRSSNTSGVPGVDWYARVGKWRARITLHGRQKYLGYFDSFDTAAAARKNAERAYFGDFAPDRTADHYRPTASACPRVALNFKPSQ